MAGLEDVFRSAAPGGNIGKPLLLALGALLASGALFRRQAENAGTQSIPAGSTPASTPAQPPAQTPAGSAPASSTAGSAGGLLSGLGGLLDKLHQGGLSSATNSWVGHGPNQQVSANQLSEALGPDVIKKLAQESGLSEDELAKQLSQSLPGLVDRLTPHGRLPTVAELSQIV